MRQKAFRSFPNRYPFSLYYEVISSFSIRYNLEIILKRNWLLGKRLNETINSGQDRAEYGKTIVRTLSQQLVVKYGNAFGERNLYHYMSFHRLYNDLFTLPESYFQDNLNAMRSNNLYVLGILNAMRSKFPIRISWTHFRILLQVEDGEARD